MNLHTDIFGRYSNHSPITLPTVLSVGMLHYHRQAKIRQYISSGKLFFRAMSVCKTIGKCFFCFSDRYSDGIYYYQRKESRRNYSIGDDVGNYITDETLNTYRRNMSVGKAVKSRSATMLRH